MKSQKKNWKLECDKRGITLIALVITIVVLLILAGVTIATLTGNNGILTQTTKAKEESEKARIIEQIQLDIENKQIENHGLLYTEDFYSILRNYGTLSEDKSIIVTKQNNYKINVSDIYTGSLDTTKQLTISCWGDSLTSGVGSSDGVSYPSVLSNLCKDSIDVFNYGFGGETSSEIAIRQGAIPITVDSCIIPEGSWVKLSFTSKECTPPSTVNSTSRIGINPCSLNGIDGKIIWNNDGYYFMRDKSGESVEVSTGTQIITYGTNNFMDDDIVIIWSGTNDGIGDANTDEELKSKMEELINNQKRMLEHANTKDYIIIGLTAAYPNIDKINSILRDEYKEHFLDIKDYLVNNGLQDAGIEATESDQNEIEHNRVPTSLLYDAIHFNSSGYKVIGNAVYNKLVSLGYISG